MHPAVATALLCLDMDGKQMEFTDQHGFRSARITYLGLQDNFANPDVLGINSKGSHKAGSVTTVDPASNPCKPPHNLVVNRDSLSQQQGFQYAPNSGDRQSLTTRSVTVWRTHPQCSACPARSRS